MADPSRFAGTPATDGGPGEGVGLMLAPVHGDMSTVTTVAATMGAGLCTLVMDIIISTTAAAEVHLEDGAGTTIWGPVMFPANGYLQCTPRTKLKTAIPNTVIKAHSSTADHITVQLGVVPEA